VRGGEKNFRRYYPEKEVRKNEESYCIRPSCIVGNWFCGCRIITDSRMDSV